MITTGRGLYVEIDGEKPVDEIYARAAQEVELCGKSDAIGPELSRKHTQCHVPCRAENGHPVLAYLRRAAYIRILPNKSRLSFLLT